MQIFHGLTDLRAAVGRHVGWSDWHRITQERVNAFGETTGDMQWIHTDPERAAAGPFGTTIAHGFLSLSILPLLVTEVYRVDGVSMFVNYGMNRVRFPAPVPVGSSIRGGFELVDLRTASTGEQLTMRMTVETDVSDKPACVAELLSLVVE